MAYLPAYALAADETVGSLELLTAIDQRTKTMQADQQAADRWRKYQALFATAGAIFAAAKLGIIAIPQIKQIRQQRLGRLGQATSNPARRRRRRR